MARQNIRLKDISEKSGYSVSAVSKALLGKADIGEETREHIIGIARDMGYRPNSMARFLRLGKSNLIGVVIPDNSNPYYSVILKEIENTAMQRGFTSIFANTNEDSRLEAKVLETFTSLSVDGIVAIPAFLENYAKVDVPVIFVSRFPYRPLSRKGLPAVPYAVNQDFSYVISDDFSGQRLAAGHLIRTCGGNVHIMLGIRRAKLTAAIKDSIRLDGFCQALRDASLPFSPKQARWGTQTVQATYEATAELCRTAERPFGICLYNDRVAVGALRAIHDAGLSVPADVGLVGFDDLEFSGYTTPPLTTVHSAKDSMGSQAMVQLITQMQAPREKRQVSQSLLKPYLVERESSRA